jgi:hypothetical protein
MAAPLERGFVVQHCLRVPQGVGIDVIFHELQLLSSLNIQKFLQFQYKTGRMGMSIPGALEMLWAGDRRV